MAYNEEGAVPEKDGFKEQYAREFAAQAQRLAGLQPSQEDETTGNTQATEVTFVTPHDPVVQTEREAAWAVGVCTGSHPGTRRHRKSLSDCLRTQQ